jgi:hypothetical protein
LAHEPNKYQFKEKLVEGYALISMLLELDGGGDMPNYANLKFPRIAAKMTPQQIEEAQQYAKDWKATHPPLSFYPDKLGS